MKAEVHFDRSRAAGWCVTVDGKVYPFGSFGLSERFAKETALLVNTIPEYDIEREYMHT